MGCTRPSLDFAVHLWYATIVTIVARCTWHVLVSRGSAATKFQALAVPIGSIYQSHGSYGVSRSLFLISTDVASNPGAAKRSDFGGVGGLEPTCVVFVL